MDLKEIKHLPTSVELDVVEPSERNNSGDRGIYDIFFSSEEDPPDTRIDSKDTIGDEKKPIYGTVSTMEWLKTWRSLERG